MKCLCEHCQCEFDAEPQGGHRLLAGDSTSPADVEALLAGAKPHLMVTDPPYGVMLDPSWRDALGLNRMGQSGTGGEHYMHGGKDDTDARWDEVWKLAPVDVFYVWCADSGLIDVHNALSDAGLPTKHIIVWHKSVLTMTRTHYWCTHEHCLYGWRKTSTAHWVGKAGQSSVWDLASPKHIMGGSKEENQPHPAQKPVECMKRPIENNSGAGDSVYEPFSGSGTTIVAAEMTGRRCYAMEIEPVYVDVAVRRWQEFTGRTAVREDGVSYPCDAGASTAARISTPNLRAATG